ncbi:chymotrypsin-like serine proteinase [Liolophura sinensis]|uniref:chymotrypsin-like serine proteinase n=1 Tax=Liolophura sinensis TaxID=3198878 RepID=UPI003158D08F
MFKAFLLVCQLGLAACASLGGFRDPILNIVGGSDAAPGQFPWQLLLQRDGSYICGAVLISADRALTAAHCLGEGYTYSVIAGLHNRNTPNGNEVTRTVSTWTMHPSYSEGSGYPNDIAILRLESPVPINNYIKAIARASSTSGDFSGKTCTLSGWGRLSGSGDAATVLQHVSMPAITNSECSSRWFFIPGASINAGHICVYQSGKSACSGDSGGPMVCEGLLAGITSWGMSTCSGSLPSVYSRVSYFEQWLDANM